MLDDLNPKIIGASMIGFALVAGAYTLSTFGNPIMSQPAAVTAATVAPRTAITVTDRDKNGIEDWRDEFVNTEPIRFTEASSTYTLPVTLTGQLGIDLIEGIVRARAAGPFGQNNEGAIGDTVNTLTEETAIQLYDVKDVTIMKNWGENDIRNYANAMAGAITHNEVPGVRYEIDILSDIVTKNKTDRMGELKTLAEVYKRTRDDSLSIPVPALFLKQHLDLINTYNALYRDIEAMTLSFDDPVVALVAIKRYQDDALGLSLALQNVYTSIEPYSGLFSTNDAAILFSEVSPKRPKP